MDLIYFCFHTTACFGVSTLSYAAEVQLPKARDVASFLHLHSSAAREVPALSGWNQTVSY